MPTKSTPYVVLLGTVYGFTLIASRFSVSQFVPLTYIGLRLVIGSLAASLIYVFSIQGRKWPRGKELWRRSIFLGIFGTAFPMIFLIEGLKYLSSGLAAILITVAPAFTVVMAHFSLPDEKLTKRKSIGISLALAGAVLLALMGESGLPDVARANPKGYLLMITAMLLGSAIVIYTRKYMTSFDSFDVSSIRLFSSAIFIIVLSSLTIKTDLTQVNTQGYIALLFAALGGTFFGMILEFFIIKHFGATAAVMSSYVIPIIASIGGLFLLSEKITLGMLLGMLLIMGGIGIINQKRSRKIILEYHQT